MPIATLRVRSNDLHSPTVLTLTSLIGNQQQTAECGGGFSGDPVTVAEGAVERHTLALANADALAQAEAGLDCVPLEFNPGSLFDVNGQIRSIALQDDGNIMLGGNFVTLAAPPVWQGIVRVTPQSTIDPTFANHTMNGGLVNRIRIGANGQVWICGNFTQVDGASHAGLALFSSTGVLNVVNANLPSEAFGLGVQTDGKAIVGGSNYLRRYNTDGTQDMAFSCTISLGSVTGVHVRSDGRILICLGGGSPTVNGVSRNGVALLETDGSLVVSYDANIFGGLNDIIEGPDGKVWVCGSIITVNGVAFDGDVVKLNADGTRDTSFTADDFDNAPNRINLLPDGRVVVSGNSVRAGAEMFLLAADGSFDASFNDITDANAIFDSLVRFDSRIAFVGLFSTIHGVARNRVAQVDFTGELA